MYKKYRLKACLQLIATISIGSLLIKLGNLHHIHISQALTYVLAVSLYLFAAWIVQAYLREHSEIFSHELYLTVCSIALGTFVAWLISYLPPLIFPQNFMINEMWLNPTWLDFLKRIFGSLMVGVIVYAVYNNLYTNDALQKSKLENEHLKQAQLRAELIGLHQQLSPHFLFNSLSTLKNITPDQDSKNFIVQLSNVYRYLLGINGQTTLMLSEELFFLRSYLYIIDQRFDGALQVDIFIPDDLLSHHLPPLSLQLLVENAIKHNAFSIEQPLLVTINVNERGELVVSNSYRPKKTTVESTGMGLQNIKERFQLLFGKSIVIDKQPDVFTVKLPLANEA